MKQIDSIQ
jgi:subtilisin